MSFQDAVNQQIQIFMTKHYLFENLILIILIVFAGCVFAEASPTLTIRKNDEVIKILNVNEIISIKGKIESAIVDNPTDSKVHTYEGISLTALLDNVFGSGWKVFDACKFTTMDGYQPIIPISSIITNYALIAVSERGHSGFTELKRSNGETVDPGPFFLVWKNIQNKSQKRDPWLSWPWQITGIELISFVREFPHSAPPIHATDMEQRGFLDFRQHCIKCHSINGDGGNVGPELNYPINVTEYWKEEWLARFIADPQSIRSNSKMIPFYRDVDNRQAIITSIIAYLKVMANKKIASPVPDKIRK
jgi:cytochrome c2